MIIRMLQPHLRRMAGSYPVVTLTGPRQSGKTTLARMAFPDHAYVSLESPAERAFALEDPLGFLQRFQGGAILDEVQRAPDLLSFLQVEVDEDPTPGQFILTGSKNFALMDSVSQSLAGRTALLELFPFSLVEVREFPGLQRRSTRSFGAEGIRGSSNRSSIHRSGWPPIPVPTSNGTFVVC